MHSFSGQVTVINQSNTDVRGGGFILDPPGSDNYIKS